MMTSLPNFLLGIVMWPVWVLQINLTDLLPGGDGVSNKILEFFFDSLSEALRGTTDEFLDVAIDVFFDVQNPYGHQEAFNAWMDSFELALAIFPIMIILGLLSMPFADEQKTSLWRQGLRAVGVIVLIALSRPLIGFGVDLANIMTHALMPSGGDLINPTAPLTQVMNSIKAGPAFVIIAACYFLLVLIAVLITLLLLQFRNFMIYVVFIMSPLLAVFWYADWGLLESVNEMANKFARMGIYSLLVGPITAVVYRTLLVISLSGFGDGFSGAEHVTAMWSQLIVIILLPFLLIATVWKLISWAGEPLGVGNAITGALVATGAAISAGVGALAGGGAMGAGGIAKGASSLGGGGGGGGGGGSSGGGSGAGGTSMAPSTSSASGSSSSSTATTGGSLSDAVDTNSPTVSASESGGASSSSPSSNSEMPGGGPPSSATGMGASDNGPKGYVEGSKDKASNWASRNYKNIKNSVGGNVQEAKEQYNPANIQRQRAQEARNNAQSLQEDKEQFDNAINRNDSGTDSIDLNQAHDAGGLDATPAQNSAPIEQDDLGNEEFSYQGEDGETHTQSVANTRRDFDKRINDQQQTAADREETADKIEEKVNKHGPRAKKTLKNAAKPLKKGAQVQAAAGKAFLKEGLRGTIGAQAPYLMQGSGGFGGSSQGGSGEGNENGGVPPAQSQQSGAGGGSMGRPEHNVSPETAQEHSAMLSGSGERFDLDRKAEYQPEGGPTSDGIAQKGKLVDPETGDEMADIGVDESADFSLSKGEETRLSNVRMGEGEDGSSRIIADENSREFGDSEMRADEIVQNPDVGAGETATLKDATLREAPGETPESVEGQYLAESQNGEIVPINAKDEEIDQQLQERVGETGDITGEIQRQDGLAADAHDTHQGDHEYNSLELSSSDQSGRDIEDDSGTPAGPSASSDSLESSADSNGETVSAQSSPEHGFEATRNEESTPTNENRGAAGGTQKEVSPESLVSADNSQEDLAYKVSPEGNWVYEDTWDEGEIQQDIYDGSNASADDMIAARGVLHEADESGNVKEDGASVGYIRFGSEHGLDESAAPEINGEHRDPEDGEVVSFDGDSGVKTRQWADENRFNFSDSRVQEASGVEHGGSEGAVTTFENGQEVEASPDNQYIQVVPDGDSSLSSEGKPDASSESADATASSSPTESAEAPSTESTATTSISGATEIEDNQIPREDSLGPVQDNDIDGQTADIEGTVGSNEYGNPTIEGESSSVPLADNTQTGAGELGSGKLDGISEGDSISASNARIHAGDESDAVELTESSEVSSKNEHSGGVTVDFGSADGGDGKHIDYGEGEEPSDISSHDSSSRPEKSEADSSTPDLFGGSGSGSMNTPAGEEPAESSESGSDAESSSESSHTNQTERTSSETGGDASETNSSNSEAENGAESMAHRENGDSAESVSLDVSTGDSQKSPEIDSETSEVEKGEPSESAPSAGEQEGSNNSEEGGSSSEEKTITGDQHDSGGSSVENGATGTSETSVEHDEEVTQGGSEYESGTFESGDTELGDREDGDYEGGEVEQRESHEGADTTASHTAGTEQNVDPETASESEVVEETEDESEEVDSEDEDDDEDEGEGGNDAGDADDDGPDGGGSGNLSSGGEESDAPTPESGQNETATSSEGGSTPNSSGGTSGEGHDAAEAASTATEQEHPDESGSRELTTASSIDAEIDHSNTEQIEGPTGSGATVLDEGEREELHDALADEHGEDAVEEVVSLLDARKKSSEHNSNQVAKAEKIGNEALDTDHPIRQEVEEFGEDDFRETMDPEVSEGEAGVYQDLVAESNEFVEENLEDEDGEATVHRGMSHRSAAITTSLIDNPDAESIELPDQEQSIAYSTEEKVAEDFAERSDVPVVAERDVSEDDVLAVDAVGHKSGSGEGPANFDNQDEGEIHVLGQEEVETDNLRLTDEEHSSPAEVIKNATENPEEATKEDHDAMDFLVRNASMGSEAPETEEGAERLKQWGEHIDENPESVPDADLTLYSVESMLEESEVDIDHEIGEEGGDGGEGGGAEIL